MGGRGMKYELAREIVRDSGISESRTESKNKIVSLYRELDKARAGRVAIRDDGTPAIKVRKSVLDSKTNELARALADRAYYVDTDSRDMYNDLRKELNRGYTLSTRDRGDIPDFNAYRQSGDNYVRITSKASGSVDQLYEDLASRYPAYFNSSRVISPSDRLQDINRVMRTLKNYKTALPKDYREGLAEQIQKDLKHGYLLTVQDRYQRRRKSA